MTQAVFSHEAHGVEWDWFACDADDHVALISSGGSGQVPPELLPHQPAIQALLDDLGIECDAESWRTAADQGLFAYDIDLRGGPFRRIAKPRPPRRLNDFPEPHRALIAKLRFAGRFAKLRRMPPARIQVS